MTNNEDKCFQCQEHGHIARHCLNNRCFECDEYGHIVMDCPHKIHPLGTPAKHHQSKPHKSHHAKQVPDTDTKTGRGEAIQGLSHAFTDTAAQVIRISI